MAAIYLELGGEQKGPFSPARVQQLLAEGRITINTLAWHEGMDDWQPVAHVLAQFPPEELVMPPSSAPASKKKGISGRLALAVILALLLPCCLCCFPPMSPGIRRAPESSAVQKAHMINLGMFMYANDHDGNYPDGKSSTEVFQKLIDGKYVSDREIFYLRSMSGKTAAATDKLTPENVCFDVTSGIDTTSSDDVPVVFSTGYTVTYSPGASALREADSLTPFPGIAVAYKNNSARFTNAASDGSIPAFIATTFVVGTSTYKQLRP